VKFRDVELYRVGRHEGRLLHDLADGLAVVYGPNEAGKSTLLSGIRGLLFGKIPVADVLVSTEPGAFGRLTFETEDGERVLLERSLHKKSQPKIIRGNGVQTSGIDALHAAAPELTQVEEILYHAVFTLQLRDLRDLKDGGKGLQDKLYAVGMLGSTSPLALETLFSNAAKEIFNPHKGAKKPRLVQCLAELTEVDAALRQVADRPDSYFALQRSKENLLGRMQSANEASESLQATWRRQKRLCDMWADYEAVRQFDAQISAYRDVSPVPSSMREQLYAARTSLAKDEAKQVDIRQQITRLEMTVAALTVDEGAESRLEDLRKLDPMLRAATDVVGHLHRSTARVEQITGQMEAVEQRLSDGWDTTSLANVDIRTNRLVALRERSEDVDTAKSSVLSAEHALAQVQGDAQRARQQLAVLVGCTGPAAAESIEKRQLAYEANQAACRRDEVRLQTWSRADDELQRLRTLQHAVHGEPNTRQAGRTNAGWWMPSLLLTIVTTIALVGISIVFQRWFAAGVSLLAGVVITTLLLAQKRQWQATASGAQAAETKTAALQFQAQLEKQVADQAGALATLEYVRLNAEEAASDVALQSALHLAKTALEKDAQRGTAWAQAMEAWRTCEARVLQASTQVATAVKVRAEAETGWSLCVEEMFGKVVDVRPAVLLDDIARVENWRQLAEQQRCERESLQRLWDDAQVMQKDIELRLERVLGADEFRAWTESAVAKQSNEKASVLDLTSLAAYKSEVAAALLQVEKAVDSNQQARAKKQELDGYTNQLRETNADILKVRAHIEAAFAALDVADWTSYEQRIEDDSKRRDIERLRESAWQRMRGMAKTDEQFLEDVALLADAHPEELNTTLAQIATRLDDAKNELDSIHKERWRLEETMAGLENTEQSFNLTWRRAELQAERRRLGFEWASMTIAKTLTAKARMRYEQAQQPPAIQEASAWLAQITGGRYVAMVARADGATTAAMPEAKLYVQDPSDQWWEIARLSRGTQEQVYLALRLGLVKTYARRNILLPMVLDDPMVNFDGPRTAQFFDVLTDVSQRQQIIYFTCHEEIAAMARARSNVQLVTLGEAR